MHFRRERKQVNGCQVPGVGGDRTWQTMAMEFWGDENVVNLGFSDGYTTL